MAEAAVYNFEGEKVGTMELPAAIFDVEPNMPVMHQALVRQLANARQGTADTLTRGEVSGGGRKPWRQKGTGRARHGSTREPQWHHGGIAHGPKPRVYYQAMPRKMRRLALRSALAQVAREGRLSLIETFDMNQPRTRSVSELFGAMKLSGKVLMLLPSHNLNLERSASNLAGAKVLLAGNLNVRDLLGHRNVVATVEAIRHIEEVFAS